MHQSAWNHEALHVNRSSKINNLIRLFLLINQKYESGSRLKIKIHICFMETSHEPLRLLLDQ
jgi:hypothetical protein